MVIKESNKSKGFKAEDLAASYLESLGYKILDRNWHYSNRGELDIVALDPKRFNESYMVFTEVKSRDESMEISLNSLPLNKQKQLKRLAKAYMLEKNIDPNSTNLSFDFIAIHQGEIEHIKDIFS